MVPTLKIFGVVSRFLYSGGWQVCLSVVLCSFLHSVQSGSPLSHTCKRQRASPQVKWSSGRSLVRRCWLDLCSPNVSMHASYFLHETFSWLAMQDKQKRSAKEACSTGIFDDEKRNSGKWNFFSISPNSHSNIKRIYMAISKEKELKNSLICSRNYWQLCLPVMRK